MRKLLGWVGAILGSSIGWWAGARVGTMTAVLESAVGTGAGLYLGWWAAERLLDSISGSRGPRASLWLTGMKEALAI